ncbi:MAG: RNHCP domain-containing protein [Opitutaceae bacterium]|nr:RNHCP domain-containing protein [Opitutaceae bacterium]
MSHQPALRAVAAYLKCRHCGLEFSLDAPGTRHRNHCPHCLWSVHLDDTPGDRASLCRGGMEPIAVSVDPRGEWHVIHRCGTCRTIHLNRIAGDDDERALLALAVRPLSRVPFPL